MTSQVIFKIDANLKEQAMRKAQNQGLAFASVLKLATKAFVDDRLRIDLVSAENFNPAARREIENALKDIKQRKNLSPRFRSAREAAVYLSR